MENNVDRFLFFVINLIVLSTLVCLGAYFLTPSTDSTYTQSSEKNEYVESYFSLESTLEEIANSFEDLSTSIDSSIAEAENEVALKEKQLESKPNVTIYSSEELIDAFSIIGLVIFSIFAICFTIHWLVSSSKIETLTLMLRLKYGIHKNKTPNGLSEYVLFVNNYSERLPKDLLRISETLTKDVLTVRVDEKTKDSIRYASAVFLEKEFINAFSKLTVIMQDKTYSEIFNNNYEKQRDIKNRTLYEPLSNAISNYNMLKKDYYNLKVDTDINDMNVLLSQDFSKLTTFDKH